MDLSLEFIKNETRKGELEYAPIPPSGRGDKSKKIKLSDILPKLKPFSVRKPVAFIVGSLAVHGESDNDIDIVVRGEDWSPEQRMAFDFRIYRMFADILNVPYDEVGNYVHIHYTNAGPFTPYVPIYEDTMMPIQNPEIVQMGEVEPMHLFGSFKILEKASKRIIAGYASIAEIDKSGDIIPVSVLKEGIKTLLSDPAYANIMLTHNNIQIGKIIPEYNGIKTHVDDKGLFIVAEIRDDLEIANKVWEKILAGEYNGFSIAGEIIKSHQECDEKQCWNVIDKINIFEVSVCRNPVNEKSGFIILSKCDDMSSNEVENMGDDENCICEEPVETEAKTEENDVDMKLEALERRLEALEKVISELANKDEEEGEVEEEKCEEPEDEDEDEEEKEAAEEEEEPSEETEKAGGLVGAIIDALNKLIEEEKDDDEKAKLQVILDMVKNLRGGYPYPYPMPTNYPYPSRYPYPTKYPYPAKAEWHEVVVNAIDSIYEELQEIKKAKEELELAAKAKDDAIKALEEKIKMTQKAEEEEKESEEPKPPETVIANESEDEEAPDEGVIIKGDEITLNVE